MIRDDAKEVYRDEEEGFNADACRDAECGFPCGMQFI